MVWAVVYFAALFSPAVLDDADGTHANAARYMAEHADFVTLHVDGIRYLEKAPLPYWAVAVSYGLFGFNTFATHLPLALATLLTAALALRWARAAFGERAGFYAAIMVLTAVGEFLFTRMMIPEVMISLMLAAALYCFARAMSRSGSGTGPYWYGIYALMALAVLTKGLIGIVFFVGPAFLYLTVTGEWRRWREFRLATGTLLFLAIAAPWHILAGIRNHGFFWFYFVNEHVLRFLGKRVPKDYNKLPWPLYWSLHLVWLFPWSLFLPLTLRKAWKALRNSQRKNFRRLDFKTRTLLLCTAQALTVLIFFAISTNQEYYTFPAYFPILLITACALAAAERLTTHKKNFSVRNFRAAHAILAVLGIAIAAALFAGLWSSRHLPFVSDIGTVLAQRGVGDYTLSMSHFFDLTGESFAALRLPALIAAVVFLLGPLVAIALRRRDLPLAGTLAIACTASGFFVAAHLALVRFEPFMSSVRLAHAFNREAAAADPLLIYGDQAFASSLIFYTRGSALLVNGNTTSLEWGSKYPDAPHIFLNDADLIARWQTPQRQFLFVTAEQRDRVQQELGNFRLVAESSGKALLSNR
ncbi:MAG: glycosyltransferase family 39 protein [Acidobacteriales bacterium]|nr:glycosyltransferase family 39 protein [Terriglobales bacterium]